MRNTIVLVTLILLSLLSGEVMALTEHEREKIQQVIGTIEVAKQLVREGGRLGVETDSEKFMWDKLLLDLEEIQSAVKRHSISPSRTPRDIRELKLEY
ncbi:hypothetical protein KUL42_38840 [Alteromonas sp. KUL42]|uniref:RAQPRD family integrative conjugative element protein n=1 Tax=Alteromonas sp. KUL42 TaxID=2480797 RepID=UPI0010366BB7|nr:RAQPRD family integrative conjugative element protein [Alteromonas sp. KUL42]TAP31691.1 hypothetical protein EYR97_19575 [Alteromonas sp. KUL42]GEA09123.1 hypothetical protein KUL42_38840 [Alteromonas sp. KUL42]